MSLHRPVVPVRRPALWIPKTTYLNVRRRYVTVPSPSVAVAPSVAQAPSPSVAKTQPSFTAETRIREANRRQREIDATSYASYDSFLDEDEKGCATQCLSDMWPPTVWHKALRRTSEHVTDGYYTNPPIEFHGRVLLPDQ